MAYTIQITDLTTDYDLVDKVSYKALMGMLVDPVEARVRLHVPDSGEARVVDIDDNDRVARIPLQVLGSGDTALDNLIKIKRWIDGATSQAVRYELLGDVKPIYLRIKRHGATNNTIHRIKWGRVDDSGGIYGQRSRVAGHVPSIVTLALAPYGEAENAIALFSDLENGDFTLSDGGGAGSEFAAEWAGIGSTTADLDTSVWMINGQSQKLTIPAGHTSAGLTGMFSDLSSGFNFSGGDACNGFAWVYRSAGSDDISIQIQDDLGDIPTTNSLDNPPAGGWPTYTDPRGITWTRISVTATMQGGASTVRLRVGRIDADAATETTWYTDGAYLDSSNNSSTVPSAPAWISYYLTNKQDGAQTTSNPENILHVDTWGIPGDAPALMDLKGDVGNVNVRTIIIGRMIDGVHAAVDQDYWIEADESDTENGGASGAWSNGTGTTNNNYSIFTEGVAGDGGYIEWDITGNAARQLLATPRRVYVRARGLDVSSFTLQMSGRVDTLNLVDYTSAVSLVTDATWEGVDLGILNLAGVLPETVPDTTKPTFSLRITIAHNASEAMAQNDTVWIDAVLLVPVEDEFIIQEIQTGSDPASADSVYFDSVQKGVLMEKRGIFEPAAVGSMYFLTPGYLTNRLVFIGWASNKEWQLASGGISRIRMDVKPRTRHLLGTI